MRLRLLAALTLAVRLAGADPPSPRLTKLNRATEDAFWKEMTAQGTPLVEDVADAQGRLLVTFLYRGKPDTKVVAVYGFPNEVSYAQLDLVKGTRTFAQSVLVAPSGHFRYAFAPGDNFGPMASGDDFARRLPLFRPDPTAKRPTSPPFSELELPAAPHSPWLSPHAGTPEGEVRGFEAKSKALGNSRGVFAYLPAGFTAKGAPYPLVVMFDAEAAFSLLGVSVQLDELIAAKKIPPVVVLFVGNADRGKELPPNPVFADFVALDLVPWARRELHATSDPRATVVAGISYGGIASTYAAARHPEVYGNVLSQSGSYWWSPDEDPEPEILPRDYAAGPVLPVRFWMEVGDRERGFFPLKATSQIASNRHMRDVLGARGYEMSYRETVAAHEYSQWRANLGDGLIALLATPPRAGGTLPVAKGATGGVEMTAKTGRPLLPHVLRTALLEGGPAALAWAKSAGEVDTTEASVNDAGYALLELVGPAEALPFFTWNLDRFPSSANAHDSAGEAFYRAGDRARARAAYARAVELDKKQDNARHMLDVLK